MNYGTLEQFKELEKDLYNAVKRCREYAEQGEDVGLILLVHTLELQIVSPPVEDFSILDASVLKWKETIINGKPDKMCIRQLAAREFCVADYRSPDLFDPDYVGVKPNKDGKYTKEDLIEYCCYYKGEAKLEDEENALFWSYEKKWVEDILENSINSNYLYYQGYLRGGWFVELSQDKRLPTSLMVILMNRYEQWSGDNSPKGFRDFYLNPYLARALHTPKYAEL